jgi:threonine/homoserine/homoserine lactone efflux protein
MHVTSLLIFAAALFVAAGSPGPSIAALVARVIAKGFRDVFPFLLAMWIGEAIWLSLAVFGLAVVADLPSRLRRAEMGRRRLSRLPRLEDVDGPGRGARGRDAAR